MAGRSEGYNMNPQFDSIKDRNVSEGTHRLRFSVCAIKLYFAEYPEKEGTH